MPTAVFRFSQNCIGLLFCINTSSSSSLRAVVRLQCRQTPMASKAEEDVLRAFKREVMEQRAIIIKALSEVSAFGEPFSVMILETPGLCSDQFPLAETYTPRSCGGSHPCLPNPGRMPVYFFCGNA